MVNLQQILFSINNQIAPRDMHNFNIEGDFLSECNIDRKSINTALSIFETFNNVNSKEFFKIIDDIDNDIFEENNKTDKLTVSELILENNILLEKLKEIKLAFKKEKHNYSKLSHELDTQKGNFKAEHDELINLRESIFKMQHNESDDIFITDIPFPHKTQKNILVFGGHDTWTKIIKPMLPDVKFISKDINPHPNLIKNADVVWLQVNSMPHKYFYSIINVIRTNHISCKYFAYASAQKCAEQLIKEEEK